MTDHSGLTKASNGGGHGNNDTDPGSVSPISAFPEGLGPAPDIVLAEAAAALQCAQTETARLRHELSETQSRSDQYLGDLQAELARRDREILKLRADLAAAEHDRRLNVTQMVKAMVAAEQRVRAATNVPEGLEDRYRDLLSYVEKLKARHRDLQEHVRQLAKEQEKARHQMEAALAEERKAVRREIDAILSSTSWRLTLPIRRLAARFPGSVGTGRQALRFVWRALGMRYVLRFVRTGRISDSAGRAPKPKAVGAKAVSKKNGQTPAQSGDPAAAKPFPEPIELLSTTGIQPGLISDYPDPWPADRPLVSVVIPCFNYSHFVHEAVESVLAQTFSDLEVLVVEGGSSSLDARQRLAELELPKTRILLQSEAHRAGANRNFGISQARGKYVCCLDADDIIEPTFIEKAVFLAEHYGYDVISTAVAFFGNRSGGYGSNERPVLKDMLLANYVPTCAVFRRELWERAGGFRDSDRVTGHVHEDWLFWVRLGALGARFWNIVGERLFHYRIHGASLSNGQDVLSIEDQREIIRELNADVLLPGVVERSSELANQSRRHPEPLRNLSRFGRDLVDTRPTVLLALPFLIIGGAERLLSAILTHLSAKGWRVIVVTTVPVRPELGDTTDWFREATKEIYHLPRFLVQERWSDFIHYILRTKKVDLLWIAGSAVFYDMLSEIRTLYPDLRVVDLLFNAVGHTANNRKNSHLIDCNIVENREVAGWLIEHGETESRIRMIESGLDLVGFAPQAKDQEILERLGLSEGTVLIGFSGRWSQEKDPLGFVEIARRVPPDVSVAFVMTGAGPMKKKIEAAVADAGFPPGRFHLLGAVPEVKPYIASYDLLCLPSRLDGRPVVVLEALALGVPVLASNVGALPELIEEGNSGRLYEPGDYDAFAEGIVELAKRPDEVQRMKQQARASAERKFDARSMLAQYEEILSNIVFGQRAGGSSADSAARIAEG
ncbi:glycosyltransferase [Microvirga sp. SM9]|nr:glycosyltransferase [Microvirga lenta]